MGARLLIAELCHPDNLIVITDGKTQHVPCLEACLLVTPLVEKVVLVHVVDVDELPGLDHVPDNPSVQRKPHLSLLKTKHYNATKKDIVITSHLCTSVS